MPDPAFAPAVGGARPRPPYPPGVTTDVYGPGRDAPAHPSRAALQRVQRELAATSREVAGLPAPILREMAPALAQAQRETAEGLRRWLTSVPEGADRYTAQRYRETLVHLDAALEEVRRLDPTLSVAMIQALPRSGAMAARHLQHEVARMSAVFEGTPRALPLNVTRILATSESYIIPRIRTSAARYAGNVANDIKRELAVGFLRGESVSAMTDRLVRLGGPRGTVALRGVAGEPGAVTEHIAEGLFKRYRYWAERVVRTETQSAYNTQLDEGFREARVIIPDLRRRWDASMDARVCVRCGEMDGEVADIGRPFANGADGAPLHPNCRCRCGAWRDEWTDVLREAGVTDLAAH